MLKNYFKIALRNLWHHKINAAINILGLAIGLAICALIFLFVRDELSFDAFHEKKDRIFRTHRVIFHPDGSVSERDVYLPMPFGPAIQATFPEIERVVRFVQGGDYVRNGDKLFEERFLYADSTFFDMFSFPLLAGDPATALQNLNSVVLSLEAAMRYFGRHNPVGESLEIRIRDAYQPFVVTGVVESIPPNSSIRFDFLLPFEKLVSASAFLRERRDDWDFFAFQTFLEIGTGARIENIEAGIAAFWEKYHPGEVDELKAEGKWTGEGRPVTYVLQPLADIHLNPEIPGGLVSASDPVYSYILAAIGLAILGIACINFTTLAIGRSVSRSKEIGVRKVVGARRGQLVWQFWGEALLLSFLSMVAGVAAAEFFLPTFNSLAGKQLSFTYPDFLSTWLGLSALVLIAGLFAGGYPALLLSSFKPVEAIGSKLRPGGASRMTKTLVALQFAASVFLIISAITMNRQLDFLRGKDPGFDKEHLVVIPVKNANGMRVLERFRNALRGQPAILGVTGADRAMASDGYMNVAFDYNGETQKVYQYFVAHDYIDILGMELVAGRNFDPQLASDVSGSVIVNEALVRNLGWTKPLGEKLTGLTSSTETDPVVIGVLKDYNFQSLHNRVEAMMLYLHPAMDPEVRNINRQARLFIRIDPENIHATLDLLRETWQQIVPEMPFTFSFVDEDMEKQYQSEERWHRILSYSSLFAIIVACLGLFGLTALATAKRQKEIGVRKVLGASVPDVALLIARDFNAVVLIGLLIAAPLAYLVMQRWLEEFAYRIAIGPEVFLLAGGLTLVIAWLAVSYQAIKAALANPVDSLRYE